MTIARTSPRDVDEERILGSCEDDRVPGGLADRIALLPSLGAYQAESILEKDVQPAVERNSSVVRARELWRQVWLLPLDRRKSCGDLLVTA